MADVLKAAKDLYDKSRIAEVPGKTLQGLQILDKVAGAPVKLGATLLGQGDKVPEGLGAQVDDVFGLPGRVATGFNPAVPSGFSQQAGDATTAVTGSPTAGMIVGLGAGLAEPIPGPEKAAKGVSTLSELTTKVAERLGGRSVVSRQFIEDLAKAPDIKAPEKNAIANALADGGEDRNVDVATFKNRLENELLPLTHSKEIIDNSKVGDTALRDRYSGISLPDEVKGDVAQYYENIYQSPVEVKAGSVHFNDYGGGNRNTPTGYFAHTRVEDLEPSYTQQQEALRMKNMQPGGVSDAEAADFYKSREGMQGDTRRVIEIQSDLFQRGRISGEDPAKALENEKQIISNAQDRLADLQHDLNNPTDANFKGSPREASIQEQITEQQKRITDATKNAADLEANAPARQAELDKLNPYKNTWYERIIREETQQAAKDGKSVMQMPTGETAMRVEGLADEVGNVPDHLSEGDVFDLHGEDYRILDWYGDGEVRVIPERYVENTFDYHSARQDEINSLVDDLAYDAQRNPADLEGRIPEAAYNYLQMHGYERFMKSNWGKNLDDLAEKEIDDRFHDADSYAEYMRDNTGEDYRAFGDEIAYFGRDANDYSEMMRSGSGSGELDVDTDSPIYKFYQDDVGKYLKKRYGATEITDDNGVTWWQYSVPKEAASKPIEAFAAIPPLAIGAGAGMQVANSTPATIDSKKKASPLPTK